MKPAVLLKTLSAAFVGFFGMHAAALAEFSGSVAYQDHEYAYELKPERSKGTYRLRITTLPTQPNQADIYQSLVKVTGEVDKDKKLVITVFRASIEKGKWTLNRESLLETTFDYAQKKVFRSTKGSFAQFRSPEYAEVVADRVTPETINIAKAIRYVMEDIIVNYNRILAPHTATAKRSVEAMEKVKVTIVPQLAVFPAVFHISQNGIDYKVNVGAINTANRRQELQVKIVEQHEAQDAGSTSTLFTSYLIIEDKVSNVAVPWSVRIHFAEKINSFTWQPYPSQFLECKFNAVKGIMTYTPSARLLPFQTHNPPKAESIEGNNGQITKEELLNIALKHFIRHYSKLFTQ
ncbi:MAG: hypothetical protein RMJ87_10815 [Cytophagales bacterium]|nr:hypothetical protein [Bernardetiaceae bacterium]MDW8205511.1 hypothetical protein [Cytophagales bacterium]